MQESLFCDMASNPLATRTALDSPSYTLLTCCSTLRARWACHFKPVQHANYNMTTAVLVCCEYRAKHWDAVSLSPFLADSATWEQQNNLKKSPPQMKGR